MYKLFCEKCICLVFLIVTFLVLICSGFPIDNILMPSSSSSSSSSKVNKKSFHYTSSSSSSSSSSNRNHIIQLKNSPWNRIMLDWRLKEFPADFRVRHPRHLRAQKNNLAPNPTGHIEATVFQNNDAIPIINPNNFIPMSLYTRKMLNSRRSLRSPYIGTSRQHQQHQRQHQHRSRNKKKCVSSEHYTFKAYNSQIVLWVKVQGIEKTNYTVSFIPISPQNESFIKVPKDFPVHECLTLQFSNNTNNNDNCHNENHGRNNKNHLVNANIKPSGQYILFLNFDSGANKCVPSYSPEKVPNKGKKKRTKLFDVDLLRKVCRKDFTVEPTKIRSLINKSFRPKSNTEKFNYKLKLVCKVNGLPLPRIIWKRNNITIKTNSRVRINYVKKRNILVIKDPTNNEFGRYECIANGVDNSTDSKEITILNQVEPTFRVCPKEKDYCMNGKCYIDLNETLFCVCDEGYQGDRCGEKSVSSQYPSRYNDTLNEFKYACELGLQTKYFCPKF